MRNGFSKFLSHRSWWGLVQALKLLTHPVFVFVSLQVVWLAIILLWVSWFLNQKEAFSQLARNLGKTADTTSGVLFLVIGCVLLGIILVGVVALFVFAQRQSSLIRQQQSFVSSVTHELRSPLASLQLSFETLQKPGIPESVTQKLHGMVSRDIERLARLINRILISSRLDRGILTLAGETERFHIGDVIEAVVDETAYLDSNIKRRLRIEGNVSIEMESSKSALNLILGNLIENALKYSPADSSIGITLEHRDEHLLITIKDEGFGLSRAETRKIFRMFHRAEIATKKAIPGTGLGLFIVKTTVRGLNGNIWVESAGPGRGSTFFVSLPLSQSPGEARV